MASVRRNILDMPMEEVHRLTSALNVLKADGTYNQFIERHVIAMRTPTPEGSSRNVAHRAPAFLPWHRASLLELEAALQAVDPLIEGFPYWQWETETDLNNGNPVLSALWTHDYIGGDGDPNKSNRVLDGPFAHWIARLYNYSTGQFYDRSGPGLVRRLGRDSGGSKYLPDVGQVTNALDAYPTYDARGWDSGVKTFRNRLEGWSDGPRLHNLCHRWVGGDMLAGTSPNDPAFWLNHCNVDRIWWLWQQRYGVDSYQPLSGGPLGHNVDDVLQFLVDPRPIRETLDIETLGYTYA